MSNFVNFIFYHELMMRRNCGISSNFHTPEIDHKANLLQNKSLLVASGFLLYHVPDNCLYNPVYISKLSSANAHHNFRDVKNFYCPHQIYGKIIFIGNDISLINDFIVINCNYVCPINIVYA